MKNKQSKRKSLEEAAEIAHGLPLNIRLGTINAVFLVYTSMIACRSSLC